MLTGLTKFNPDGPVCPTPLHLAALLVALATAAFTLHPVAAVAALTQTVALASTLLKLFLVLSGGTPGALAVLLCTILEAWRQLGPARESVETILGGVDSSATGSASGVALIVGLAGVSALSSSTRHALGFVSAMLIAKAANAAPLLLPRWLSPPSLPAPPTVDGVDGGGDGGALSALGLLTTAMLFRR